MIRWLIRRLADAVADELERRRLPDPSDEPDWRVYGWAGYKRWSQFQEDLARVRAHRPPRPDGPSPSRRIRSM